MKLDVVEEFLTLASINSPSGRERPLADYLLGRLAELGLEAKEDDSAARSGSDTGNVVCRVPESAPGAGVLLCAHMDTVSPTEGLIPVLKEGVIASGGGTILGADDKAGIAVILTALAEVLAEDLPHGPLEVVFSVQEEAGLFGVTYLTEPLQADYGYVLDGDGPVGNIINQAPSKIDLDLTVEGLAAHAGVCPEKGINAVVVAARAISRLKSGRLDDHTTSNVGVISGGRARNIVPDLAQVAAEVRSTDLDTLEREVRAVLETFQQEAQAAGAKLTFRKEEAFRAFTIAEDQPVVAAAFRAARAVGVEPRLWSSGGGMDANVFNLRGLPCVGLGIGGENAHSPHERIAVADLRLAVRFVKALLAEALYR